MEINEGDIVQLKSGGPKMTYSGKARGKLVESVDCDWFINDEHKHGIFSVASLKKYNPEDETSPVLVI